MAATRSQLHAYSTGQRLRCPDDPTCPYSTSDKSALLRHRQRKHGYRAKPTASKDKCMDISRNSMDSSEKLDDPSNDDSSPSSPLEKATHPCCPCCSSVAFESSGQAYSANDENDIWHDDDHAPSQAITGITNQTNEESIESTEWSFVEGHVTSRFPVSFARTLLPRAQWARKGCTVTVSIEALPLLHTQLAVNSSDSGPFQQHRIKPSIENPRRGESQRSCYI